MVAQPKAVVWIPASLFLLMVSMLGSCTMITEQDFLALNDRVVALNARVNRLEDSLNKQFAQSVDSKLKGIRANQAEIVAELDKIKEQVQGLSGRVEENSYLIKRSVEKDTTKQDIIKAQLAELTKRVESLEAELKGRAESSPEQPKIGHGAGMVSEAKVESPSVEKPPVVTEKDFYDHAMALFKEGKYEEAIACFKGFLQKYPTSDLADNAQFWIGESYVAKKQFEKAILAYQRVIEKYPDGNKVPGAMLKQALAFYEIKDKVSARLLLKKIIRKYPNSNEAKIAAAKLKAMK